MIQNARITDKMKYPYIDMHCDTLLRTMVKGADSLYDGEGMQSILQMKEAGQMAQFFAVFFPQRDMKQGDNGREHQIVLPPDDEYYEILKNILYQQVEKHKDVISLAKTGADIENNAAQGLMSAILSIEDGRLVNSDMEKLRNLRKDGVCAISLTWNDANCFGYPNSKDADIMSRGLTDFGKEAIEVMNEIGILVDVSHLSDGGFWDVARISGKPFVATHSNCRALSPNTRNLTDEMIRTIANQGGVSGLNFCPEFLSADISSNTATVELLTHQVLHMLNVGGEEFPAFGTDYDGIGGILEIGHPTEMDRFFDALEKKGMTASQLEKFASKNALRVLKECCI